MRGIRGELTNEWKQRNVGGENEYAILTAEISKAHKFKRDQGDKTLHSLVSGNYLSK